MSVAPTFDIGDAEAAGRNSNHGSPSSWRAKSKVNDGEWCNGLSEIAFPTF